MYLFNSQTNYVFPQNIVTCFSARAEEVSLCFNVSKLWDHSDFPLTQPLIVTYTSAMSPLTFLGVLKQGKLTSPRFPQSTATGTKPFLKILPHDPSIAPNFFSLSLPSRLSPTPHWAQRSAADDASCPGLVFGSRLEVGYGHLHRLDLLMFGRDGAELVGHLVAFNRHILALDAGGDRKKGTDRKVTNDETDFFTQHRYLQPKCKQI